MTARLVFIGLLSLFVLPICLLVGWSFVPRWNFPQFFPNEWSGAAWAQLVNGKLGEATLNSFLIAMLATIISITIGFPSGRFISRGRTLTSQTVQVLVLFPTLLPTAMLAIGVQFFFVQFNLSGTLFGVVLSHLIVTLPYATLISVGIFSTYNFNFELQARTLGATEAQAVWFVTGRALGVGMASVALFSFLISWSQFVLTVQIGAGRVQTLPMLVFAYLNGGNMQFAAASTVMLILPTLAVLLLAHQTVQAIQSRQV